MEEEVTELLGREKSERRSTVDSAEGYRNGYGKPRRLAMSSGTITLRRPRVRGVEERFESRVLPLFARRTKELGALLPELYLSGLAEVDFELAMRVWARIEDHQLIETLQTRGLRQGLRFTKSQIVRAGLRALDAMTPGEFGEAVEQSEPLKPRDHGSDVIQRSLKSENRYSTLFLPEDTGSGRTQSRSAAGARVPLRSAAFRPTALRPIVRREPRGHQRLACPLPDPLPAPHKPALRRSPAPAPRSSGVYTYHNQSEGSDTMGSALERHTAPH